MTAVTESTMTVKVGTQELTFYIDGETHLEVRRRRGTSRPRSLAT